MTSTWDDEDRYWRAVFVRRPYTAGVTYDVLWPGYRYGYEAASRYGTRSWADIERDLEREWEECDYRGASTWEQVKEAVRDAWARTVEMGRSAAHSVNRGGRDRAFESFARRHREDRRGVETAAAIIGSAAAGAALALAFDPDGGGRRRRVRVRDAATRATRKTRDALDATARDVANRARGVIAERRRGSESADDRVLRERVRAQIGHVVSRPRDIDVDARAGHVTLRGRVHASEEATLLSAVRGVHGVGEVTNALHAHEEGEPRRAGGGFLVVPARALQSDWTPAARVGIGAAGTALAAWGLSRGDRAGLVAGAAGALLAIQAATNAGARLMSAR